MIWIITTVVALGAAVGLHLFWRARYLRSEAAARREFERLAHAQEQQALQSKTQQEAVFNSMTEGLLLLDQAGRIQLANRAFAGMFHPPGEVLGKTIMEAVRLHELAALVDLLDRGSPVLGHELRISPPNERWLEVNGTAIFNGSGRRQGALLVFHDLTRLKQLEKTRQEFVANVSHELRTPLSLIKGYVETLLGGAKDRPDVSAKFLETIDRNAERLRLLIEDLLTISELESGRVKLNLQPVALPPLVDKIFADFKARASAKSVKFVAQAPEIAVTADANRLEQVLGNLLDNAIKYGRAGGTVTIGGHALENKVVEIFVADDGPGIPPAAIERVFERFFRVDKARSREQGGTGLGLSIVKHIVQSHGGRVWAKSDPGRGATFCFTLPRAAGGHQPPLL